MPAQESELVHRDWTQPKDPHEVQQLLQEATQEMVLGWTLWQAAIEETVISAQQQAPDARPLQLAEAVRKVPRPGELVQRTRPWLESLRSSGLSTFALPLANKVPRSILAMARNEKESLKAMLDISSSDDIAYDTLLAVDCDAWLDWGDAVLSNAGDWSERAGDRLQLYRDPNGGWKCDGGWGEFPTTIIFGNPLASLGISFRNDLAMAPFRGVVVLPEVYLTYRPYMDDFDRAIAVLSHELEHTQQGSPRYTIWGEANAYLFENQVRTELGLKGLGLPLEIQKHAPGEIPYEDIDTLCQMRNWLSETYKNPVYENEALTYVPFDVNDVQPEWNQILATTVANTILGAADEAFWRDSDVRHFFDLPTFSQIHSQKISPLVPQSICDR